MPRLKNVERLRKAGLIAAQEEQELDPEMEAVLNKLSREELEAIIAVKQKLGLIIELDRGPRGPRGPHGPMACGF